MLRIFKDDVLDPEKFTITLELVPGGDSTGRSVDTVMGIAADAFSDGRVSAVSITDNPGGNPSLSPDVIGHRIFTTGMDVIVHFTCRDTNRVGMESRALQLAMMGMKNILALTGDFAGKGFGGQGAPVFDLDSVQLQILLGLLSERMEEAGDPDGFFAGCAVSPFKWTEAESFAQYSKLCRKIGAGAGFVITQLGYDAAKFGELIRLLEVLGLQVPVLGSVYMLTPMAARVMNAGRVPGAVVTDQLLAEVEKRWISKTDGRQWSIEHAARLAAVLKGLGYRGIHIGGIHKDFETAGMILDRFEQIQEHWRQYLPQFRHGPPGGFQVFDLQRDEENRRLGFGLKPAKVPLLERLHYLFLKNVHRLFFDHDSALGTVSRQFAALMDASRSGRRLVHLVEYGSKRVLLGCRQCGDCAIEYAGFLCPEAGCPKHTRNGPCGGSRAGCCEVFADRYCVWYRAYRRIIAMDGKAVHRAGCVPPRLWELDRSSSWLNFHLGRDHHSTSNQLARRCDVNVCTLKT